MGETLFCVGGGGWGGGNFLGGGGGGGGEGGLVLCLIMPGLETGLYSFCTDQMF